MQVLSRQANRAGAENLVHRLVDQLTRHALWDALLLFAPPAAAAIAIVALLFHGTWLTALGALFTASFILALAAVAVFLRRRPLLPSLRGAARLVDQRSGAKDHFLTLATIDPASQSASFLARLRVQSEGLAHRVELGRDFPYRFKRSAYCSLGVSLAAALLIYFVLPGVPPTQYRGSAQERLAGLVERLTRKPNLRGLGQELNDLAAKLDQPKTLPAEKQAAIENLEQRIEEQQTKEKDGESRELLGEAASALNGLEKEQQIARGQDQRQEQKGGGGIQSNAPQDGQGENKQQSQGGSGDGKSESGANSSQEKIDQGKSAQANPKDQGQNKNQAGDTKNTQNQPDPNQASNEPTKEKAGKNQGGSKDGAAGRQQASEEPPPQGGSPADRFYKPGEGKDGLAAKGYVTVQLPEEVIADAQGESRPSKEAKSSRARTQVPVSNVPLPAHVPNAPSEKQQVPIEYRGILR
jgi:hypothetical protein